jgi:hypothetical protein
MLTALAGCDIDALVFTAEMYGVQLDQLAAVLGVSVERARGVAVRWQSLGLAESARLGPGPPWVWATRPGMAACGMGYTAGPPPLSRLAHIRAVTAVRLALQGTTAYQRAHAFWRGERRIRAAVRAGLRDHLPDGELHWPSGPALSWTGECWAIQAELTHQAVTRTTEIMREVLGRTGDYGCPGAQAAEPGRPPRHARALYLCSPAALPAVSQARDELGTLGARIEIRNLPASAALPLMPCGEQTAQVVGALPDVGDRAFAAGLLGQDGVLFQDIPAAVVAASQVADDGGEVDITVA